MSSHFYEHSHSEVITLRLCYLWLKIALCSWQALGPSVSLGKFQHFWEDLLLLRF